MATRFLLFYLFLMGDVEVLLLQVLAEKPAGVSDADLKGDERMRGFSMENVANAINVLIGKNRLELFQSALGLTYKFISEEDAVRLAGLNREQKLVYRVVEQAGDMGIWIKDIRMKTNLQSKEIEKILKTLTTKRLVKAEKHHKTLKKVYMLFDLTPNPEIAGGSWYTGMDFDVEFIDSLQKTAAQFFRKQGKASLDELAKFISESGISRIELSLRDVQTLVNTLIYDGIVEPAPEVGDSRDAGRRKNMSLYRPTKSSTFDDRDPFVSIPCSVCPITSDCIEGTEISPSTCEYYRMWLDF